MSLNTTATVIPLSSKARRGHIAKKAYRLSPTHNFLSFHSMPLGVPTTSLLPSDVNQQSRPSHMWYCRFRSQKYAQVKNSTGMVAKSMNLESYVG
ncbi:cyclohexanone monooxygenase [Moniliophthora roreri]|nr:cyclohexanone monooxygenase [Moniliophthora roreri]